VSRPAPGARRVAVVAAVVVACAAATFVWTCLRKGSAGRGVRADQWHHLYLALVIAAGGAPKRSPILLALAALVAADDAWQHVTQVTADPGHVSPLHQLFATYLWPLAPVRRLVRALDAVFG
jgi:hypothetical protein